MEDMNEITDHDDQTNIACQNHAGTFSSLKATLGFKPNS